MKPISIGRIYAFSFVPKGGAQSFWGRKNASNSLRNTSVVVAFGYMSQKVGRDSLDMTIGKPGYWIEGSWGKGIRYRCRHLFLVSTQHRVIANQHFVYEYCPCVRGCFRRVGFD